MKGKGVGSHPPIVLSSNQIDSSGVKFITNKNIQKLNIIILLLSFGISLVHLLVALTVFY